jgi:hypothetical protein
VTISSLVPQTITGAVYNVRPNPGEPARFGIVLNSLPLPLPPPLNGFVLPPTVVQSGAVLRQSDFGLDTVVHDIPHTAALIGGLPLTVPVHINSMDLTLDGVIPSSGGKTFMRNPTSCTDHVVKFNADSYSSTTAPEVQSHFTPTNCGALDFSPAFTALVGGAAQGAQTTAVTSIDQDDDEAGLLDAHVVVPPDLAPNTLTDLLSHRCPLADFQAGTCLDNTVVGNAIATSPLLSLPLAGQVHLVDSGGGLLPNIGLDLRGQLHLLLQGSLNVDKSVTFAGLPDIPISHFQLAFSNPPGLLIANHNLCEGPPPVFHADFTGYNGANTSVDSPATVVGSCNGGSGNVGGKCKKASKKKRHHRAAEAKKKHKKRSCKKKKRKKRK